MVFKGDIRVIKADIPAFINKRKWSTIREKMFTFLLTFFQGLCLKSHKDKIAILNRRENMRHKGRKRKLLMSGFVTLALAVVILVTYIIGQNTGQKAVLAEAFVDKVSDQVSDQMDQDMTNQIAEKTIERKIQEIITPEKISEAVSDNIKKNLTDAQKNEIVKAVQQNVTAFLKNATLSNFDTLSDGQKKQVKKLIRDSIKDNVEGKNINSLTQSDLEDIQDMIIRNVQSNLKTSVSDILKSGNLTLSNGTIKDIEKNLDISGTIKKVLKETNTVVKEKDLVKLQKEIVNSVKESVKTPVKGVDYLTQAEIDSIQNAAAKNASSQLISQLDGVKQNVTTISSNVGNMQMQINGLSDQLNDIKSGLDVESKIATVQTSINTVNEQIKTINQNADALGGKIEVRNSFLRRITAKNGSIDKAEVVDTSEMTIAEFVGVLSGNEKEYTTAINQLSYSVEQIKKLIGENFKTLSDECASLSASIDANGDNITTLTEALAAESQQREEAITNVKGTIESNISDVQKKLDNYKKASQDYADDQSEANRTALADAKQALEDSLNSYKGNLDNLSTQVDGLDNATKSKISNINEQIAAALESIESGDNTLDEKIGQLTESTTSLTDALQKAIEKEASDRESSDQQVRVDLGNSINEKINDVNEKMSAVESAQKKYTDDASQKNADALAQAKSDLQEALNSLNDTLSQNISDLDSDTQKKVKDIKDTIARMNTELETNGTDISTLKTGVADLVSDLSDVSSSLEQESTARDNADKAILNSMGDSSDASVVKGDTIFAKIKTLWNKITEVSNKVDSTDQWCDNIVLHNSTGANDGKDVYYEEVNSGTYSGGVRWKVDGNLVGLSNIKETSNINIQYSSSTPDIVCGYEQGVGFFYIYVGADYKDLALTTNITIDMVHVESVQ